MKMTGLSFDNIPPLRVPFRFFMTAPLFGIAAGLLLMLSPDIWLSRWHPALLGFTHLLTLGFMAMVMLGALFQLMPVVSSQSIPAAPRIAPWVHLLLCAGTLSLVSGFMDAMNPTTLIAAVILLALGFATFLGPLLLALIRVGRGGDTVFNIRLAAAALLIALGLGIYKALSYASPATLTAPAEFAEYHIGWGFGGWVVLLVMGVSFQVIPMFHVAPNFNKRLTLWLSAALFISLLAVSLAPVGSTLLVLAIAAVLILIISYALYTLHLIQRRKRKRSDTTIHFWQLGLGSLIATCLLIALQFIADYDASLTAQLQILAGLLFGFGFAISIIEGMLQKIVPFLIYMHLQRQCMTNPEAFAQLPNMKTLIPSATSKRQFQLHCLALFLLTGSLFVAIPGWLTGVIVIADFGWLLVALLKAQSLYRRTLTGIEKP